MEPPKVYVTFDTICRECHEYVDDIVWHMFVKHDRDVGPPDGVWIGESRHN